MLIDTFTIIAICTLVLLVILSSVLNPFLRNVESAADADENEVAESEMPAVSIVVLATGTTETLDAHLSVLLTQNYEQPYEVIVVGVKGDLSTEDVIGKYSSTTRIFIPHTSRNAHSSSASRNCLWRWV